jgi:hypothetical protein
MVLDVLDIEDSREGARRDATCVRLALHSAGLVCRLEEVQDALVDDLVLAN